MNEPEVVISLDRARRIYEPGELISFEFRVPWSPSGAPTAIEVSIVWYTEGKGDEDLAVHFFDRVERTGNLFSSPQAINSDAPHRDHSDPAGLNRPVMGRPDSLAAPQSLESFRRPHRYSVALPNSPLSYEGVLIKLRWCVRVRAFWGRGRDFVAEEPFRLGHVPAASPLDV